MNTLSAVSNNNIIPIDDVVMSDDMTGQTTVERDFRVVNDPLSDLQAFSYGPFDKLVKNICEAIQNVVPGGGGPQQDIIKQAFGNAAAMRLVGAEEHDYDMILSALDAAREEIASKLWGNDNDSVVARTIAMSAIDNECSKLARAEKDIKKEGAPVIPNPLAALAALPFGAAEKIKGMFSGKAGMENQVSGYINMLKTGYQEIEKNIGNPDWESGIDAKRAFKYMKQAMEKLEGLKGHQYPSSFNDALDSIRNGLEQAREKAALEETKEQLKKLIEQSKELARKVAEAIRNVIRSALKIA